MDMGIGFSEILLILILVLVFFGSKELPIFMRKAGKLMAEMRIYTNKIRSELDSMAFSTNDTSNSLPERSPLQEKKIEIRKKFIDLRKAIPIEERIRNSSAIYEHLKKSPHFCNAGSILIYSSIGAEVMTFDAIADMLKIGKRVILPYCSKDIHEMGIAEIRNTDTDLVTGTYQIKEPKDRTRFFKSDVDLVICPGVAFDVYGVRLGRGKAYYDKFLRELKEKVPIYALAFGCQISPEPLPSDYHDVRMDQIITESGPQLPVPSVPSDSLTVQNFPAG
jgi:5-formyltetrahydrofolate cyclo-ligase